MRRILSKTNIFSFINACQNRSINFTLCLKILLTIRFFFNQRLNVHTTIYITRSCFNQGWVRYPTISNIRPDDKIIGSKEEFEVEGFFIFSQQLFSYFQPLLGALTEESEVASFFVYSYIRMRGCFRLGKVRGNK